MPLKSPQVIPAWQRVVGVVVALGLIYFLYRGGTGGFAGTAITICMLFFVRSLHKSGAIKSNLIPEASALRPRSFVRDALMAVGTGTLGLIWAGVGGTLVKRQILADSYFSAAIIFGPSLVLMLVGAFFVWRMLNGFMYGRRR
jgi:hypothetical protein